MICVFYFLFIIFCFVLGCHKKKQFPVVFKIIERKNTCFETPAFDITNFFLI